MNWVIFLGAFTGSLIELVEILAVVLVVGRVAGWRNALVGAGSAVGLVVIISLAVGKGFTLVPIHLLEIVAGVVLLIFGGMWALSVIRYYGGTLRQEDDEEERLARRLAEEGGRAGWDPFALTMAFKSSLLESAETAIIVVTLGLAGGDWFESVGGALVAAAGLIFFAFLLRTSLQRIPIKPTKFFAAMLLMGFGTYWLGEGLELAWPGGSLSIVWLPLVWGLLMAACAAVLRRTAGRTQKLPD